MRQFALVLVAIVVLAGCGSGHKSSSTPQDQIKSAYVKFFSPSTSLADRVALLQNGQKFKPVIQSFASNPLAKNVSATVSSVTLQGANNAKVVFSVKFGSTSLGTHDGTAVRQNGTWKVGYRDLCNLVALSGSTPSACKP